MRITELLEGKNFKDIDFVKKTQKGNEIDFDLVEDLAFFMHNDDDTYRRHVYPSIAKCLEYTKQKKKTSPVMFKTAALESYKNYLKEYPIRELPDSLDSKMCKEICEKLHNEFKEHHNDGKYKD